MGCNIRLGTVHPSTLGDFQQRACADAGRRQRSWVVTLPRPAHIGTGLEN